MTQVIAPDAEDGVSSSANMFRPDSNGANGPGGSSGGGGGPSGMDEDAMIDGPGVPIEELISLVRHSKLPQIKDALDYLPNKKFDKSLVQVLVALYCVHLCYLFVFARRGEAACAISPLPLLLTDHHIGPVYLHHRYRMSRISARCISTATTVCRSI